MCFGLYENFKVMFCTSAKSTGDQKLNHNKNKIEKFECKICDTMYASQDELSNHMEV